jgi:hypothetical protein
MLEKRTAYEVVQVGSVWVLQRQDRTPLVEFPTRRQAVRAGIAVSLDEGLTRLVIRGADGLIQEVDPVALSVDTLEA